MSISSMWEKPANYMVWAILTTLFCCLPLGIASIVYAAKVDKLWDSGDYDGAIHASANAKRFAVFAAIGGMFIGVGAVGLTVLL